MCVHVNRLCSCVYVGFTSAEYGQWNGLQATHQHADRAHGCTTFVTFFLLHKQPDGTARGLFRVVGPVGKVGEVPASFLTQVLSWQ